MEHKRNKRVVAIGKFPDMIEYDNFITIEKFMQRRQIKKTKRS
jgi:hypothetical protein